MSATHLIYQAAGFPPCDHTTRGICALCGVASSGQRIADWIKPTFVDHDKLQPGGIICAACLFCADDRNPQLTACTQRDKPQRMRNYSHLVVAGVWRPYGKHQKAAIWQALQQSPSVAVVAMSGQKHLCFRARAGWWHIEESAMRPEVLRVASLMQVLAPLYAHGWSKAQIAADDYDQRRVLTYGVSAWQDARAALAPHRGTLPFQLALWLVQRADEETDADAAA